jgi:hypothetical protein
MRVLTRHKQVAHVWRAVESFVTRRRQCIPWEVLVVYCYRVEQDPAQLCAWNDVRQALDHLVRRLPDQRSGSLIIILIAESSYSFDIYIHEVYNTHRYVLALPALPRFIVQLIPE